MCEKIFTSAGAASSRTSSHAVVSPSGTDTEQLTYAVETSIKVSERHHLHVIRPDYCQLRSGDNRVGSHATTLFNLLVPSATDSEETIFTDETSIKQRYNLVANEVVLSALGMQSTVVAIAMMIMVA